MRFIALMLGVLLAGPAAAEAAHDVFGRTKTPAPGAAQVFGSYAKGCLAGARQLPTDGPGWAAMRLKRDRRWGHPALIDFIARLAAQANATGLPGLLIGDMGQVRGGPMKSGHRSHQIGLDVDIWLRPMAGRPAVAARESLSSFDLVRGRDKLDRALWAKSSARIVPLAAKDPAVARIFVNPTIKRAFCRLAPADDRAWLAKLRPWWGHDAHFHVRLACPADASHCEDQQPVPAGDGCGDELAWWFTEEPYTPDPDRKPRKPLTLDDLPPQCAAVAAAR